MTLSVGLLAFATPAERIGVLAHLDGETQFRLWDGEGFQEIGRPGEPGFSRLLRLMTSQDRETAAEQALYQAVLTMLVNPIDLCRIVVFHPSGEHASIVGSDCPPVADWSALFAAMTEAAKGAEAA